MVLVISLHHLQEGYLFGQSKKVLRGQGCMGNPSLFWGRWSGGSRCGGLRTTPPQVLGGVAQPSNSPYFFVILNVFSPHILAYFANFLPLCFYLYYSFDTYSINLYTIFYLLFYYCYYIIISFVLSSCFHVFKISLFSQSWWFVSENFKNAFFLNFCSWDPRIFFFWCSRLNLEKTPRKYFFFWVSKKFFFRSTRNSNLIK